MPFRILIWRLRICSLRRARDLGQFLLWPAQARGAAIKAQPGVITDEELERERGGSGLRYSFDVRSAKGVTYEIGVDAKTGAVLEHSLEGPNAD